MSPALGMFHIMPGNTTINRGEILSIQSHEVTLSDPSTSVTDAITAVTKNKSYILYQYKHTHTGEPPDDVFISAEITNSTTVTFDRQAGDGDVTIRYWVVEFRASVPANVQHFSLTPVWASNQEDQAITAVDLAHSFPLCSFNNSGGGISDDDFIAWQMQSTTNLRFHCRSSRVDTEIKAQVIENPNWDVTEYTDTMINTDITENTPITAVTLNETWLLGSYWASTTGTQDANNIPHFHFSSTTNIQAHRAVNGCEFSFFYYVVESNSLFHAQHFDSEQITITNATATTAISAVDTAKSIIKMNGALTGNWATNNTASGENASEQCILLEFSSSTLVQEERIATTDLVEFSYCVIDHTDGF